MKQLIKPSAYRAFAESRAGKCDICSKTVAKLFVDHDHNTGAVRGMLCPACNSGLGLFKDDPVKLQSAITYLAKVPVVLPMVQRKVLKRAHLSRTSCTAPSEITHIASIKDVGDFIRSMRIHELKKTQQKTAEICGITTKVLSFLETGKPTMQVHNMFKALTALGVKLTLQKVNTDNADDGVPGTEFMW